MRRRHTGRSVEAVGRVKRFTRFRRGRRSRFLLRRFATCRNDNDLVIFGISRIWREEESDYRNTLHGISLACVRGPFQLLKFGRVLPLAAVDVEGRSRFLLHRFATCRNDNDLGWSGVLRFAGRPRRPSPHVDLPRTMGFPERPKSRNPHFSRINAREMGHPSFLLSRFIFRLPGLQSCLGGSSVLDAGCLWSRLEADRSRRSPRRRCSSSYRAPSCGRLFSW